MKETLVGFAILLGIVVCVLVAVGIVWLLGFIGKIIRNYLNPCSQIGSENFENTIFRGLGAIFGMIVITGFLLLCHYVGYDILHP
jgi:hypothetical protein